MHCHIFHCRQINNLQKLIGYKGAEVYYKVKYKDVAVSRWSNKTISYRKYGAVTIKALLGDLSELLPEIYSTKEALKSEIERSNK